MKIAKLILTSILLLSYSLAHSQWPESAITHVNEFNQGRGRELFDRTSGNFRAVLEQLSLMRSESSQRSALSPLRVRLPKKYFALPETARLGIDFIDAKSSFSRTRRDLVVIIPGIFQGSNDKTVNHISSILKNLGYHVLAFPSPFSREYISRFPYASVGSFEIEAQLFTEAIQEVQQMHGQFIAQTHLIGISYGAFLSSILIANDTRRAINGRTYLFGPQVKLKTTLALLDEYIDARGSIVSPFKGLVGQAFFEDTLHFTANLVERYVHHKERNFAERDYLISSGNFESIPVDLRDIQSQTIEQHGTAQFERWKASTRFWKTVVNYTPENLFYYERNMDEIGFWLKKAHERGYNSFGLITTQDDFTNNFDDWYRNQMMPDPFLNPQNFLIRRSGSHISYTTTEWFSEFLRIIFPYHQNPP